MMKQSKIEGEIALAFSTVKDIYLEAGEEGVLLLHSFTSNANEMRKVAQALHKEGYTCYVPNLAGHGFGPEYLFMTSMADIYIGAQKAVETFVRRGMKRIFIIGQSLGGVLAIRLAGQYKECVAIGIVSSPVIERPIEGLEMRVQHFSTRYLTLAGRAEEEKEAFLSEHFPRPKEKLVALQQFIVGAGRELKNVQQPVFLAKGLLDEKDFHESIDLIEQTVSSNFVMKREYPHSGHLITLGKEREVLQQDLIKFLNKVKVLA